MDKKPGNEENKCSFKDKYNGPDNFYSGNLFSVQP